jgi:hypothetical protein
VGNYVIFYLAGAVTGLSCEGTGSYNNKWYIESVLMVGLNGAGTGYHAASGTYYIEGTQYPSLNSLGTGWHVTGNSSHRLCEGSGQYGIYFVGGVSTITSLAPSGLPCSGTGWLRTDNVSDTYSAVNLELGTYYISGGAKPGLNSNGTGWVAGESMYYVAGAQAPALNNEGTGFVVTNDSSLPNIYCNASLAGVYSGMFYGKVYINGEPTSLNCAGTGWITTNNPADTLSTALNARGKFYIAFVAYPGLNEVGTGISGGTTYVLGIVQQLSPEGNGYLEGIYYELFVIKQGWSTILEKYFISGIWYEGLNSVGTGRYTANNVYYVGGESTSLPVSGTGAWGDSWYIEGIKYVGVDASGNGWHAPSSTYYLNGVAMIGLNINGTGLVLGG